MEQNVEEAKKGSNVILSNMAAYITTWESYKAASR